MAATSGQNGVTINANDVTIDLNGFTLTGSGNDSGHGIYQAHTFHNLTVLNGKLVEWRGSLKGGVYANARLCRIHGIQATTNCYGIFAGSGGTISDCSARNNSDYGISAGYGCTISGCATYGNGNYGIYAYDGCMINNCSAFYNSDFGVFRSFIRRRYHD